MLLSHWNLRIFSGLFILHKCEDHFYLYSLSAVHSYHHIYHITNNSDDNKNKKINISSNNLIEPVYSTVVCQSESVKKINNVGTME